MRFKTKVPEVSNVASLHGNLSDTLSISTEDDLISEPDFNMDTYENVPAQQETTSTTSNGKQKKSSNS